MYLKGVTRSRYVGPRRLREDDEPLSHSDTSDRYVGPRRLRGDDVKRGGDDFRKGREPGKKVRIAGNEPGNAPVLSEALHQFEDGLGMAFGFYLVINLDQFALFVDYKCRTTDTHVGFTHELALAPGAIKFA